MPAVTGHGARQRPTEPSPFLTEIPENLRTTTGNADMSAGPLERHGSRVHLDNSPQPRQRPVRPTATELGARSPARFGSAGIARRDPRPERTQPLQPARRTSDPWTSHRPNSRRPSHRTGYQDPPLTKLSPGRRAGPLAVCRSPTRVRKSAPVTTPASCLTPCMGRTGPNRASVGGDGFSIARPHCRDVAYYRSLRRFRTRR